VGKPSAPAPPDYAAAATAQGAANENAALATSYLNRPNQVTPYGSLTYSYDPTKGEKLPDGTVVPGITATTTLSPDQQTLLDQQTGISKSLNNLASQGIGYVANAVGTPETAANFNPLTSSVNPNNGTDVRDQITNAYMARLQPQIDQDRASMEARLANQGITNGSQAYAADEDAFNRSVNDQRTQALLAGDAEQQNEFQRGLASSQFANQAQQQAISEADYFRNQPLNELNALRTGNQVTMPQFGSGASGATVQAAPIYQATADQYNAAMQQYQTQMQNSNAFLSGLAQIGGAAIPFI
jgi:hypothetical protein